MSTIAKTPWRGVNLGHWLLLERWMQPALFAGTTANDEYGLCEALGSSAECVMRRHRETFITADDFAWLRDRGVTAVRIPFGYWLLNPEPPFVSGADMLDRAIHLCQEYGLTAVLDLHGLPGFQSVEHHSGRSKYFRFAEPDNLRRSLDFVEQVAQRYKDHDCVGAISVVNEPSPELPTDVLMGFYEQSYQRIRKHMSADRVTVVIAAFTEKRVPEFHRKVPGQNILTDIHPYPCFCDWKADQLHEYVAWGLGHADLQRNKHPEEMIVGEWSLGVAPVLRPVLAELPAWRQDILMRAFACGELTSFEQTAGWFFWSYKVECTDPLMRILWGFRAAVERGWLPGRFG
jgi:glucan 1,3-beta-glucosidase